MKYTGREGWGGQEGTQNSGYQWDPLGADQGLDFGGERSAYRGSEAPGSLSVEGLQLQESSSGPVQTIIFENTNFKGADKMFKAIDGTLKDAALQVIVRKGLVGLG